MLRLLTKLINLFYKKQYRIYEKEKIDFLFEIAYRGNYENGVKSPYGDQDEGSTKAGKYLDEIREYLRSLE